MIIKEHTRNQKRMYRIHKMEEQIEKDKYIIGKQKQIIDKAIEYIEKETKELYSKNRCCKYLGEIMQLEYVLNILRGEDNE